MVTKKNVYNFFYKICWEFVYPPRWFINSTTRLDIHAWKWNIFSTGILQLLHASETPKPVGPRVNFHAFYLCYMGKSSRLLGYGKIFTWVAWEKLKPTLILIGVALSLSVSILLFIFLIISNNHLYWKSTFWILKYTV